MCGWCNVIWKFPTHWDAVCVNKVFALSEQNIPEYLFIKFEYRKYRRMSLNFMCRDNYTKLIFLLFVSWKFCRSIIYYVYQFLLNHRHFDFWFVIRLLFTNFYSLKVNSSDCIFTSDRKKHETNMANKNSNIFWTWARIKMIQMKNTFTIVNSFLASSP